MDCYRMRQYTTASVLDTQRYPVVGRRGVVGNSSMICGSCGEFNLDLHSCAGNILERCRQLVVSSSYDSYCSCFERQPTSITVGEYVTWHLSQLPDTCKIRISKASNSTGTLLLAVEGPQHSKCTHRTSEPQALVYSNSPQSPFQVTACPLLCLFE